MIWHWKAFSQQLSRGFRELESVYPPMPFDTAGQMPQIAQVAGPATAHAGQQGRVRSVKGQGAWDRGVWVLELRAELPAEQCRNLFIAFSAWKSSEGDRGGQKSFSIWHHLEIEE